MSGFHRSSSSEHTGHRFGFNGKEKDDEVSGSGNSYDYGFRIYNPRIGKFLSVDPLTRSYPWYTPYQFAGNMPIWAIDLDGLEEWVIVHHKDNQGTQQVTFLHLTDDDRVNQKTLEIAAFGERVPGSSVDIYTDRPTYTVDDYISDNSITSNELRRGLDLQQKTGQKVKTHAAIFWVCKK